jgi:hypothetical protein
MESKKVLMTVNDLLGWAYQETQLAEALELMAGSLPEDVRPSVVAQAAEHRRRSRWLDQQVEWVLNEAEKKESAQPE